MPECVSSANSDSGDVSRLTLSVCGARKRHRRDTAQRRSAQHFIHDKPDALPIYFNLKSVS